MSDPVSYNGRRPSLNARGDVRGFRSRPGAPKADPSGMLSQSDPSGTPQSLWDRMFKNSVTGETPTSRRLASAPMEVAGAAATAVGNPAGLGIAGSALDATFGAGFWNKLMNKGPSVQYSPRPALNTPAPFIPQDPRRPFNVPEPLTSPFGDKNTDRANLAANRSIYAPGGAQGMWGKRVGSRQPAPTTDVLGGNGSRAIISPYGVAAVNFSGRNFRGSQNADARLSPRGGMSA